MGARPGVAGGADDAPEIAAYRPRADSAARRRTRGRWRRTGPRASPSLSGPGRSPPATPRPASYRPEEGLDAVGWATAASVGGTAGRLRRRRRLGRQRGGRRGGVAVASPCASRWRRALSLPLSSRKSRQAATAPARGRRQVARREPRSSTVDAADWGSCSYTTGTKKARQTGNPTGQSQGASGLGRRSAAGGSAGNGACGSAWYQYAVLE